MPMAELEYRGADGCPLFAFGTRPLDDLADRDSPVLVMMHGGGPDHRSLIPLAKVLSNDAFRSVDELLVVEAPTLLFAGADWRHPAALARKLAQLLPRGRLGEASMNDDLRTTEDFAQAFAPEIGAFIREVVKR